MFAHTTIEDQFESFKKEYILNTELLIKALQELHIADLKNPVMKAELALMQSKSSTSFMMLCKLVFEQKKTENWQADKVKRRKQNQI